MTIRAQMELMAAGLDAWAKTERGSASVVGSIADLVDRMMGLRLKPGGLLVMVAWNGEQKRGEFEEASMADRGFTVVVYRGLSLTAAGGDTLVKGAAGGKALFDLVEGARDVCRALSFTEDETEVTLDYKGAQPFVYPDGVPGNAYQLDFTLGSVLPGIEGS